MRQEGNGNDRHGNLRAYFTSNVPYNDQPSSPPRPDRGICLFCPPANHECVQDPLTLIAVFFCANTTSRPMSSAFVSPNRAGAFQTTVPANPSGWETRMQMTW